MQGARVPFFIQHLLCCLRERGVKGKDSMFFRDPWRKRGAGFPSMTCREGASMGQSGLGLPSPRVWPVQGLEPAAWLVPVRFLFLQCPEKSILMKNSRGSEFSMRIDCVLRD